MRGKDPFDILVDSIVKILLILPMMIITSSIYLLKLLFVVLFSPILFLLMIFEYFLSGRSGKLDWSIFDPNDMKFGK